MKEPLVGNLTIGLCLRICPFSNKSAWSSTSKKIKKNTDLWFILQKLTVFSAWIFIIMKLQLFISLRILWVCSLSFSKWMFNKQYLWSVLLTTVYIWIIKQSKRLIWMIKQELRTSKKWNMTIRKTHSLYLQTKLRAFLDFSCLRLMHRILRRLNTSSAGKTNSILATPTCFWLEIRSMGLENWLLVIRASLSILTTSWFSTWKLNKMRSFSGTRAFNYGNLKFQVHCYRKTAI